MRKGERMADEQRRRISEALRGRPKSDETRARISRGMIRYRAVEKALRERGGSEG